MRNGNLQAVSRLVEGLTVDPDQKQAFRDPLRISRKHFLLRSAGTCYRCGRRTGTAEIRKEHFPWDQLLIKLFIKNPDKTDDPDARQQYGKFAGVVGIVSGLLLCLMKSGARTSFPKHCYHCRPGSTIWQMRLLSIITLVGFKLAAQPEDEDHPYGHARIEYLTGLFVSIFIIVIGLQLLQDFHRQDPSPGTGGIQLFNSGYAGSSDPDQVVAVFVDSSIGKRSNR